MIKLLQSREHKEMLYSLKALNLHQAILFLEDIHLYLSSSRHVLLVLPYQFMQWNASPNYFWHWMAELVLSI